MLNSHIGSFHNELKRLYPDFPMYSLEVRLALFDMIFNLGMTKLNELYPKFNRHVKAQEWQKAADQSHRKPPIGDARNKYVKDLLEKVANQNKSGKNK